MLGRMSSALELDLSVEVSNVPPLLFSICSFMDQLLSRKLALGINVLKYMSGFLGSVYVVGRGEEDVCG